MATNDTDTRQTTRVLQALQSAKLGLLAREVIDRTGLQHSQVQAALSWLRTQHLIEAREDSE